MTTWLRCNLCDRLMQHPDPAALVALYRAHLTDTHLKTSTAPPELEAEGDAVQIQRGER